MKKVSRKLISVLTILAFILQIFAPTWTYAQDAQNQKAQIEKSVAEYQKTYDAIMAIKPLELGGMANFTINAIDTVKSWGSNIAGFFKGESKEEREKRQKEEEYNKYKAQIDRANEDIKKLKADAEATMKLLKSGSLQAAAKTDPTKVYNSLDQNASAMGIYQKALREAGESLVSVGDKIAAAGTAIGLITAILIPIAVIFPAVAPAVPIFKGISIAITVAVGVVKATGNTLITAAEKAITDDKSFIKAAALETTLQAAESTVGIVTSKVGLGTVGSAVSDALVGGTAGTIRETNRAGVALTSAEARRIAGREMFNSAVSATVGAAFDAGTGQIATSITKAHLADPSLDLALKSGRSQQEYDALVGNVTDAYGNAAGVALDPVKSGVTDALSIEDEEDQPKANAQPGLSGGGSW
ncbi:MAG TPA: hypothetical protein VIV61_13035 [Candidatus Ozemobacteraceae bacterium]